MTINIKFVPRDFWIGVFWKTEMSTFHKHFSVYICLVPMFPIVIKRTRLITNKEYDKMWEPCSESEEDDFDIKTTVIPRPNWVLGSSNQQNETWENEGGR